MEYGYSAMLKPRFSIDIAHQVTQSRVGLWDDIFSGEVFEIDSNKPGNAINKGFLPQACMALKKK